jgi:hypothetical protein
MEGMRAHDRGGPTIASRSILEKAVSKLRASGLRTSSMAYQLREWLWDQRF